MGAAGHTLAAMALTDSPTSTWVPASNGAAQPGEQLVPRRRARGLSFPALPGWPLLTQLAGGVAAEVGVWQVWGRPVALLVGGVVAVVVGALRESGRI